MDETRLQSGRRTVAGRPTGWRFFLSPAGALLAAVCFFLPWGRVSCAGVEREVSGAEVGGWLWLVFAAAAILLVAPFAGRRLARPRAIHAVARGAALFGPVFLCWRAIEFSRGARMPFGRVHPEQVGFEPAVGFAGTVLGLLMALAGAWLPHPAPPREARRTAAGEWTDRRDGTDRPSGTNEAGGAHGTDPGVGTDSPGRADREIQG